MTTAPTARLRPLLASAFLVVTATSGLLSACYRDDSTAPGSRRPLSRVLLTDSPFPYDSVTAVEIYIESIAASEKSDTTGMVEEDWVTVATPRRPIDLMKLQNGETELLGEGALPAGKYRAVRMVINTANSRIVGVNGNEEQVNWYSSYGQPTLYALVEGGEMEVPEGGADIVIDFDVGRSFVQDFPGTPFSFLPWLRAVNRAATGSIAGAVQASLLDGRSLPVPNATITVFRGSASSHESTWSVAATARTDAQGDYKVAFLMPGSYIVRAEAPGPRKLGDTTSRFLHADTRTGASVARGGDTPLSFSLGEVDRAFLGITPDSGYALAPGDTAELSVVVSDSKGRPVANPAVSWTSTNPDVATVTGNGPTARVAGIALGTANVIARSGELADTVPVTVTTDPDPGSGGGGNSGVAVGSLSITPAGVGVSVGDTVVFVATPLGTDGQPLTNRAVAWSVTDSTVAYFVSPPSGPPYAVVRGRARGTISVVAVCEGETAIARLTVQ